MRDWTKIEASVLEFPPEAEAEEYYSKTFLPSIDQLKHRCIFVCDPAGIPVATATAWYVDSELGHQARLDWVTVRPQYQGMGLGKAVVRRALAVSPRLEPGRDIWLSIQTWSYRAVLMYHGLGFNIVINDRLATAHSRDGIPKIYSSEFADTVEVLKPVLNKDSLEKLIQSAV